MLSKLPERYHSLHILVKVGVFFIICSDIKPCITNLSASLNIKNTYYYVISQQDVCNCVIPTFLGVVKYVGRMPTLV